MQLVIKTLTDALCDTEPCYEELGWRVEEEPLLTRMVQRQVVQVYKAIFHGLWHHKMGHPSSHIFSKVSSNI